MSLFAVFQKRSHIALYSRIIGRCFFVVNDESGFPPPKAPNLYYSAQQLDQIACLRASGGEIVIPKATQLTSVCNEFYNAPAFSTRVVLHCETANVKFTKTVGRNNNKFYFVYLHTRHTQYPSNVRWIIIYQCVFVS